MSDMLCDVQQTAFSQQIFIEIPNIKLRGNRPVGAVMLRACVRACVLAGSHYEANSRFI